MSGLQPNVGPLPADPGGRSRHAGALADRLPRPAAHPWLSLHGSKPAEAPCDRPSRFEPGVGHGVTIQPRCGDIARVQPLCAQSGRHSTVGGSMSEAIQGHMAPMPAWLVFSGATAGIVGASVTKHARRECRRTHRRSGPPADTSNLAAVAPGEWGLGLLIVGAVVTLSGLVIAARRPNLNVTEPVTAASMESATSRGWEPRQLLDLRPNLQTPHVGYPGWQRRRCQGNV